MTVLLVHEIEVSPWSIRGGDLVRLDGEFVALTHRYKGPEGRCILGAYEGDREIRGETIADGAKVTIKIELPRGECPRCHLYKRKHGEL
jgi:hypothetical protein